MKTIPFPARRQKGFPTAAKIILAVLAFVLLALAVQVFADTTSTALVVTTPTPAASSGFSNPFTWLLLGVTHLAALIGGIFASKQTPQNILPDVEAVAARAAPLVAKALALSGNSPGAAIATGVGELAQVAEGANAATAHVTVANGSPNAVQTHNNQQAALVVATQAVAVATQIAAQPKQAA